MDKTSLISLVIVLVALAAVAVGVAAW